MTTYKYTYTRSDVLALLGDITAEGLRRLIKAKKFPTPDVDITARTQAWNRSTLIGLGYELPEPESIQAASALALAATAPNPSSSAS